MSSPPTLVLIPGSWHKPTCFDKIIKLLQNDHKLKCTSITLPSTDFNPDATFRDDVNAARDAITSETAQGRDVIVVAHSYGGVVGSSAIKGLTRPEAPGTTSTEPPSKLHNAKKCHVVALVLIASGFAITGLAFMDPLLGIPPPSWRVDKETGYATLVADPRELFYHDLPDAEADYWTSQLTTQSLKALFEGGEYAYSGWRDLPTWYVGTAEDKSLPVVFQRMQIGMIRGQGGVVQHTELLSGHSPFLSLPERVVEVVMDAVGTVSESHALVEDGSRVDGREMASRYRAAAVSLYAPSTWFKFGLPILVGRVLGWGIFGFLGLRNIWRRR